jgi:hypothetical protein
MQQIKSDFEVSFKDYSTRKVFSEIIIVQTSTMPMSTTVSL